MDINTQVIRKLENQDLLIILYKKGIVYGIVGIITIIIVIIVALVIEELDNNRRRPF